MNQLIQKAEHNWNADSRVMQKRSASAFLMFLLLSYIHEDNPHSWQPYLWNQPQPRVLKYVWWQDGLSTWKSVLNLRIWWKKFIILQFDQEIKKHINVLAYTASLWFGIETIPTINKIIIYSLFERNCNLGCFAVFRVCGHWGYVLCFFLKFLASWGSYILPH